MKRTAQAGFTLIELVFASLAAMVIMVPTYAMLNKAQVWYNEIQSQIAINRHARLTFEVLIHGARSASTGVDGTKWLYGLNGRKAAPPGNDDFRDGNYAFEYSSNRLTITPDKFSSLTINCTGVALPLPDCGTGTRSVTGWIGNKGSIGDGQRTVAGRTMELEMTITDAHAANRSTNPTRATEIYRTIATFMRDENDQN